MRIGNSTRSLAAICFLFVAIHLSVAEVAPFYLKSGDTVVFFGDSITEQSFYCQWVELYTVTRFPQMRVHFFGAGVGGDRVSGGIGGSIDERLARDVLSHHPSVVTVMLGMNDGAYKPLTSESETAYRKGYEHILTSLRFALPGLRVTVLGPSPFNEVTGPAIFPGGYNSVVKHFAEIDMELAQKYGDTFVNLNPAVVALLERAQATDPRIGRLLIPDGAHPEPIVHWLMAETVLKGWNAPSLVSSVSIDASRIRVEESENATVQQVERRGETLRWTAVENALPLPLNANNAVNALLLELTDIQKQLNKEMLYVTGFTPGLYMLVIDGETIGEFSAAELSKGINLADYETPMHRQAQSVAWLIRDRTQAHFIHTRMLIHKADTGERCGKQDVMNAFENSLEDTIYEAARPQLHEYSISRLVGPS